MTIQEFRKQFPVLDREVYGKPLVYLDSAATSQRPASVVEMQSLLALQHNANVHRAVHRLSAEATEAYENARDSVRHLINAENREEIIFTSGTTASINLVACSFGERYISEGDEIIIAESEHHSNIVPWQLLAERKGARIVILPLDDNGRIEVEKLPSLITPRTKIICVAHVSNVTGLVAPLNEIIRTAHASGVKVLVDGAQGIVHQVPDVQKLNCDFYAFSAHKMYGATGVGVLYGKKSLLDDMPPFMGGGEMIDKVDWEQSTFDILPYKFEAGTPNFNSVPTLVPASELLKLTQSDAELISQVEDIKSFVYQSLISDDRVQLRGVCADLSFKTPIFSFNVKGAHHEDLAQLLDKMGYALRSGHMCAQPLMRHFGVSGILRASFAPYNTMQEAEGFIAALDRAIKMLTV